MTSRDNVSAAATAESNCVRTSGVDMNQFSTFECMFDREGNESVDNIFEVARRRRGCHVVAWWKRGGPKKQGRPGETAVARNKDAGSGVSE